MQGKVGGEHGCQRARYYIRKSIDVRGRQSANDRRATIAVGSGHVRITRVIGIRITTAKNRLPSSRRIPGKPKSWREVALRQSRTTLRYGVRATFDESVAVSEPILA